MNGAMKVHLAGIPITLEGRYVRQLCSWCGHRLIDVDLSNVMVPEGQAGGFATWEPGKWVRVNPPVTEPLEAGNCIPPGACTEDVLPRLQIVK